MSDRNSESRENRLITKFGKFENTKLRQLEKEKFILSLFFRVFVIASLLDFEIGRSDKVCDT